MSVIQNKLVPVDYDGNGTTDLGFLRPINFLPTPTPGVTIQGELAAWLFDPATGLPAVQSTFGGLFTYANGDFSILGDGFIPGFGGAVNEIFTGPAPLFPDFNGDGNTDQVFGSLRYTDETDRSTFEGYELATWLMDGVDVLQQQFIVDSAANEAIVLPDWANPFIYSIGGQGPLGDFDGNGTSDILFLRNGDNSLGLFDPTKPTEVAAWLMQGNVAFSQQIIDTAEVGYQLINTNDFDANGTTDLLFSQDTGGDNSILAIWTLSGITPTSQTVLGDDVGVGWSVVDTNDFDGNGTADILFTQAGAGDITNFGIWTLSGTQIIGQNKVGSTSDGWGFVDHNDFNGDGKADLLFSRTVDSGIEYAFWLLDGTNAPIAQERLDVATPGFEFANSGDVNGDGIADLSFYNATTKEIALWYLGSSGFATSQISINYDSTAAGWQPPFEQPLFDIPPFPNPLPA